MLKISAHVSKKVPLPGRQYSSQQFGASLELEVSDGQSAEDVQERLRRLYATISRSIDEQIAKVGPSDAEPPAAPRNPTPPAHVAAPVAARPKANGLVPATQAQQRAIFALCKSKSLAIGDVIGGYGASDVSALSLRDASRIIDQLKAG